MHVDLVFPPTVSAVKWKQMKLTYEYFYGMGVVSR